MLIGHISTGQYPLESAIIGHATNSFSLDKDKSLPLQSRLHEVAYSKGITPVQIARRLDVTRQAVVKWFAGELPGKQNLEALCTYLRCQPGDLFVFIPDSPLSIKPREAVTTKVELLTAGYEGEDLETFIAKLRTAHVEVLVDTREIPLSRKKGFSKSKLSEGLADAGIEYRHFRQLGTQKPWRDAYHKDKDWGRLAQLYSAYLPGQQSSVEEIFTIALQHRTCLFCFEADHNLCHRGILASHMANMFSSSYAVEIIHL